MRAKSFGRSAIIVCIVTLVLTSGVSAQTPPPAGIDSLKSTIDSLLHEKKIAGASVALVNSDSIIWSGGVGYANYAKQKPVTDGQLFRTGSVSKTFVSLGIMQLVQQGKLNLDDEVQQLVPEIEITNPWRDSVPVRIKHLLEHTAGFDDMHFSEFINVDDDPRMPLEEALEITPASRVVRWKPGTRYSYSNPGYAVAGYIIEEITGQPYEQYLKNEVLQPIGMSNSSFWYTDSVKAQLVTGYHGAYQLQEYKHIYLRPAGYLHTSAREMAGFVQMMLNDGSLNGKSIIADSLLNRMETPQTSIAAKRGYKQGYGLGIRNSTNVGYSYLGHAGGIPGYAAQYMYFPEYNRGYVLLINSMGGFGDIGDAITRYLLRDVPSPEPEPSTEISREKLTKYQGYYEHQSPRNELFRPLFVLLNGPTLSVVNDTLQRGGFMTSLDPMVPVSEQRFRGVDEAVSSTFFMDTQRYGQVMVWDGNFYVKAGSWKKYVYRGAFFGGLGLLASLLLVSIFWIPFESYRYFSDKQTPMEYQRLFWWPFVALLSMLVLGFAGSQLTLMTIGQQTTASVLITISTYLFGVASAGSMWVAYRGWQKNIHWGLKTYFSLVAISLAGFSLFFLYWDLMGLRLWAY
jgi:CubicO group peptidase (beta-lactamase class C family)